MAQRKTANGKMIDMTALAAKHERVRAVGNMNVNARGDIIDSHNRIINDSTKRVNRMYNKTMQRVSAAQAQQANMLQQVVEEVKPVQSELDNDFSSYDDGWDAKLKK